MQQVGLIEYVKVKIKEFLSKKLTISSPSTLGNRHFLPPEVNEDVKRYFEPKKPNGHIYINGIKMSDTVGDDVVIMNGKVIDPSSSEYLNTIRTAQSLSITSNKFRHYGITTEEAAKSIRDIFDD